MKVVLTSVKSALTSINPPHTNNIFSGIKGVEWRTRPMPTGKHYCYETKKCFGLGKVIGEFRVWRIAKYPTIDLIPEGIVDLGCVPREFLEAYSKGKPIYAHFFVDPVRYDEPKELSEFIKSSALSYDDWLYGIYNGTTESTYENYLMNFKITRPPQSWCYVKELGVDKCENLLIL